MNDYIVLMKPVATSLDRLQGEERTSAGSILPCLYYIRRELQNISLATENHPSTIIQNTGQHMKNAIITAFTKRFQDMLEIHEENKELIIAAVSHPAFKLDWVEPEDETQIKYMFESEARKYYEFRDPDEIDEDISDGDIFVRNRRYLRRSSSDSLTRETDDYMEHTETNLNMLEQYPTIKKMFYRFNTSLSSSAPVERVFSRALLIYTPRRNRLSDENFERALFKKINKNL